MTIPVHEGCCDYLDIPEDENDKKSDKKNDISTKSSIKSSMIIEKMKENPAVTLKEMANMLQMSKAEVRKIIERLRKQRLVKRIGPTNGGYWQVL